MLCPRLHIHAQSTHTVVCLSAGLAEEYLCTIHPFAARTAPPHAPHPPTGMAPTNGDERMGGRIEEICTTNVSDSYRAHATHTHTPPLPSAPSDPACVHQVYTSSANRQTDRLLGSRVDHYHTIISSGGSCVGAGRCVATVSEVRCHPSGLRGWGPRPPTRATPTDRPVRMHADDSTRWFHGWLPRCVCACVFDVCAEERSRRAVTSVLWRGRGRGRVRVSGLRAIAMWPQWRP